jgi:3',5'-cyclic AMP phosphodiesterase CpdA
MRWFIGLHPKYFGKTEELLGDFSESSADILYTHIDFLRADIDYPMKDKTLVFFIENPTNDPCHLEIATLASRRAETEVGRNFHYWAN